MEYFREHISPLLTHLDSETTHLQARDALYLAEKVPGGLGVVEKLNYQGERFSDPRLTINYGGNTLESPLMVGAGWTKNGKGSRALVKGLGFAGVEAGSMVLHRQPGNEKPRQEIIVLPDGRVISWNALGFNQDEEAEEIAGILDEYLDLFIEASMGANKDVPLKDIPEHLARLTKIILPRRLNGRFILPRVKGLVINHSTPNTPDRRKMLGREFLRDSNQAVMGAMKELGLEVPVANKYSPDMPFDEIDDALEVAKTEGISGIIYANTTVNRGLKEKYYTPRVRKKYGERFLDFGGLAGDDPEYRRMLEIGTAYIYRQFTAVHSDIFLWGAGAMPDAETAYDRIKAGANGLKDVTAIRAVGPTLSGRKLRGIVELMERDGITDINQAVGVEANLYEKAA